MTARRDFLDGGSSVYSAFTLHIISNARDSLLLDLKNFIKQWHFIRFCGLVSYGARYSSSLSALRKFL